MGTKGRLLLVLLLAFAGITCKKETLQPGTSTTPTVFSFNGNINGSPVSFTGGVDNYFMYSSYTQDKNSVYNYTGGLHQTSTSDTGANSIQFIINDFKAIAKGSQESLIDSALKVAPYIYASSTPGIFLSFSINYAIVPDYPTDPISSTAWNFGDGTVDTAFNLTPNHHFPNMGIYKTTLKVKYASGIPASAYETVGHTVHDIIYDSVWTPSAGVVAFYSQGPTGGTPPYSYKWNFGNGLTSSSATNPVIITYPDSTTRTATLVVTDSKNNTDTTNVNLSPYKDSTFVNFTTSPNMPDTTTTSGINLSAITIIYTDGTGTTYSTANVPSQPGTSKFQILKVAAYQNNQSNQTTKMLNVTFNCELKSYSGKTITISNGQAVIAVAYK